LAVGTVAKNVPQTLAEADKIVVRIRGRREKNKKDRQRLEEIDAESKKLKANISKRDDDNIADQELVQAFSDAHRDELTKGGKSKSFRFPSGAVGRWGLPSKAKLIIGKNLRSVARVLLNLPNWENFVEVRLKKDNIKAHLDELHEASPTLRRELKQEKKERFRIET
jgi:phage host-nuclease inhibitor protein Gam